jgi:hypothetical protein
MGLANYRYLSKFVCASTLAVWTFGSTAKAAPIFYAVDTNADQLVTIDAVTGNVRDIGSLGVYDATSIDLAILNGHLYALNTNWPDGADLLEIDRETGEATVLGALTHGEFQVSCRIKLIYAADFSPSGFSLTISSRSQFRVPRAQRSGFLFRAAA